MKRIGHPLVACLVLAVVGAGAGCAARSTSSAAPGGQASPSVEATSPSPSPAGEPAVFLPAPDSRIPRNPGRLAEALVEVTTALRDSIDRWTTEGDPSAGRPPRALVLQALYQQRIYRTLARLDRLREETIAALPGWLAPEARSNAGAGAGLISSITPVDDATGFRTGRPDPAGVLLGYYREAEDRFGVDWEVLAAVNFIESKFGRVTSASSAGAQGPMQFIPSTWEAYGLGGDVHDDHDAIIGAANYLQASGAPGDYQRALYAYNHSSVYVDAVLLYARQMMRDSRDYLAYYNWQVFVLTTSGDVRLTGPGL